MSKDDALAQRRLASFLKRLPDARLLQLLDTWEQLRHWKMHRGFYKNVSLCWKAIHKGEDDPIRCLAEAGEINWGTYNHVWLTVLFYERLWELLVLSFRDVSPEINRLGLFQPKTAFLLFQWIAFDEANTHFAVCLEPYCEVSSNKLANNYRLLSKVIKEEATSSQKKKAEKLGSQNEAELLMGIILEICHKKATRRRPALKAALQAFYVALNDLNRHSVTLAKAEGCYAWNKGERVRALRGGSYSQDA